MGKFSVYMTALLVIISDKTMVLTPFFPSFSRPFDQSVLGAGEALLGPNDGRQASNDHH